MSDKYKFAPKKVNIGGNLIEEYRFADSQKNRLFSKK